MYFFVIELSRFCCLTAYSLNLSICVQPLLFYVNCLEIGYDYEIRNMK